MKGWLMNGDFGGFFNYINDFAFVLELTEGTKPGSIHSVNTFACDKLGYTVEELTGKTILELLDPIPNDHVVEILSERFVEKKFEASFRTQESVWIDLDVQTYIQEIDGQPYGIIIARDITDLKRFEEEFNFLNEELINQKENFQALIDNLTQTQEQLVLSEKMAALGQLIAGIAHEINTPLGAIKASVGNMSDSLQKTMEIIPGLIFNLDENEKTLFVKLLQISDLEASANLSSRDKRKLRRALAEKLKENEVEGADSLADICIYLHIHDKIDEIMPMFKSSDIKVIMSAVKNIVSLDKNNSTISIAVEKAHKVVFALKKFAHHDSSGEMIETDIIDSIETVLTLYNNQIKQGITVVREFDNLPMVTCYADEINQVWTNLIHNSLQAMGQVGTLTVGAAVEDNELIVKIGDTGSGIEPEIRERIFEPFYTTKKSGEGSGLGLDIVKKIIEKHDGFIDFESIVNEGTTFKIVLPIKQ